MTAKQQQATAHNSQSIPNIQLIQERTGTVIHKDGRLLRDPASQARGLMFTRKKDFCLIFAFPEPRRATFHMWFVFYPIDILFLDKAGKILAVKERFMPFTVHTPPQAFSAAIELPAGSIRRHGLVAGDILTWKSI